MACLPSLSLLQLLDNNITTFEKVLHIDIPVTGLNLAKNAYRAWILHDSKNNVKWWHLTVSFYQIIPFPPFYILRIWSISTGFGEFERLLILSNPIYNPEGSLRFYVVKMMPNLKYFNDVSISDQERIMATSSIRSLHQPTDYVMGDESEFEFGPRDGR